MPFARAGRCQHARVSLVDCQFNILHYTDLDQTRSDQITGCTTQIVVQIYAIDQPLGANMHSYCQMTSVTGLTICGCGGEHVCVFCVFFLFKSGLVPVSLTKSFLHGFKQLIQNKCAVVWCMHKRQMNILLLPIVLSKMIYLKKNHREKYREKHGIEDTCIRFVI